MLEQDGRFMDDEYTAAKGLIVSSDDCPELFVTKVCLRGTGENDLVPDYLTFKTNGARDEYRARVIVALADWAENCPAFVKALPMPEKVIDDTYTF